MGPNEFKIQDRNLAFRELFTFLKNQRVAEVIVNVPAQYDEFESRLKLYDITKQR
jgi:hypothetical protein